MNKYAMKVGSIGVATLFERIADADPDLQVARYNGILICWILTNLTVLELLEGNYDIVDVFESHINVIEFITYKEWRKEKCMT